MLPGCFAVIIPLLSYQLNLIYAQTLVITNGPMDTTVCNGGIGIISCGFVNESISFVPNWRIIRRSDDGSVISNMTVSASDIISNTNDGREWIPDTTSGVNMSPNSRLLVGPVDETYNQTSYQCIFTVGITNIQSSVGTLTVAEILPVENLTVVDQCTIIRASWDITEGSCTHLSYDVTLLSSDGVILQGPFTTSDTVYNFNDVETFNGNFNVSVVPINGNLRGTSVTERSVINVLSNDLPTVAIIRHISTICVASFNISWDAPNITCGDVSYEVSVSQDLSARDPKLTVDRFYHVTELNNSLPVTITVTATDRVGQRNGSTAFLQLRVSEDSPPVHNLMPSNFETPDDVTGFDITISWERPMINPCTTLPITGYHINITVIFMNGSFDNYMSNFINDTSGDNMGRFNVNYNEIFNEPLKPNSVYALTVIPTNRPGTIDDETDDELSTGAVIGITFAVTFIITLVVTALISVIITSMCYKRKSSISQEGDLHTLTEDTKRNDPAYATTIKSNVTMDTNPAYGTATTIKMDTNPAYATTS